MICYTEVLHPKQISELLLDIPVVVLTNTLGVYFLHMETERSKIDKESES